MGHGQHGHEPVPDDSSGNGTHGAGTCTMERDGVRARLRHVGGNDDRHDDAVGSSHDPCLRPRRPAGGGLQ
jgi:hypothetical protein